MPDFFISADWSRNERKRSVHVADFRKRSIWREERADWCLPALLTIARELAGRGSVLVGIDAALGVPLGYWHDAVQARRRNGSPSPANWLDWLRGIDPASGFFEPVREHNAWHVNQPFFHVPKGKGARLKFTRRYKDDLRRRVERSTAANPLFIVGGISGTVGAGTAALWRELISPAGGGATRVRRLALRGPVARSPRAPACRPGGDVPRDGLRGSLGRQPSRSPCADHQEPQEPAEPARASLRAPADARWVRQAGVNLGDLGPAQVNDDAFDSHLTAAAALRCVIEKRPLYAPEWIDAEAEGAMLLAGPVDPAEPSRALTARPSAQQARLSEPRRGRPHRPETREYPCPVPGCEKVFRGSRGGWDAHVASPRKHSDWQPALTDHAERKRRFREEFKDWFSR